MAVQIIGSQAQAACRLLAQAHHPGCGIALRQGVTLQVQAAGTLNRQRVHRKAVRPQAHNGLHGARKGGDILPRQPGDHIHVDIGKAKLPRQQKRFLRLRRGMVAPNGAQGFIVHGLRVDADAPNAQPPERFKLAPRDGIGPARFHSVFPRAREQAQGFLHQAGKGAFIQRGRRAPAHVQGAQTQPRSGKQLRAPAHFVEKRVQIGRDQLALSHGLPRKGAVGAARAAKRDGQIHIRLLRAGRGQLLLLEHNAPEQLRLFGAHVKGILKVAHGLVHRAPFGQGLVQQARGPYARKRTPGGPPARKLPEQAIQRLFAKALAHALQGHLKMAVLLRKGAGLRKRYAQRAALAAKIKLTARVAVRLLRIRVDKRLRARRVLVYPIAVHGEKQLQNVAQVVGKARERRMKRNAYMFHSSYASVRSRPTLPGPSCPG